MFFYLPKKRKIHSIQEWCDKMAEKGGIMGGVGGSHPAHLRKP